MISVNADFGKKIVSIHTIGVLGSEVWGFALRATTPQAGFNASGIEVRGALRFRFEAKKNRTIFASNLKPLSSKQP
jgi:hypothetical protein